VAGGSLNPAAGPVQGTTDPSPVKTALEVEVEIDRLSQLSTRPRAVRQLADAMRWVLGLNPVPVSDRLWPKHVNADYTKLTRPDAERKD
jgi:hypothetical protein